MADGNLDYTDDSKQKKSAADQAKNAGKKLEKTKKNLNRLKWITKLAPLVTVISVVAIVLLVIFLIIGYVGFFSMLPGLTMEKFKNTAEGFWKWAIGYEKVEVSSEEINSLATYINDMGYDIVGYGFARSDQVKIKTNESTGEEVFDGIFTDEELKKEDSVATSISKSNLYAYILAAERTYCVSGTKNHYVQDFLNLALGTNPVYHLFKDFADHAWAKRYSAWDGMLVFDEFSKIEKAIVNVNIDREAEKMTIDTGIINRSRMTWELTDWTSKYGKPIELSLALHLSTMAPDFVYDFCMDDDLQTKINLGTNKIKIEDIKYKYQKEGGEPVTSEEVIEAWEERNKNGTAIGSRDKMFSDGQSVKIGNPIAQTNKESFTAPIDIIYNTTVISITRGAGGKNINKNNKGANEVYFYRAVLENGDPVDIDFDDPNKNRFKIKFKEHGEPYLEPITGVMDTSDKLSFAVHQFAFGEDEFIDIDGKEEFRLELLSLNALKTFLNSTSYTDDQKKQALKGANGTYKFISEDRYIRTFREFDIYVNGVAKQEDIAKIDMTLKKCDKNDITKNEFIEWKSDSGKSFKQNASDTWENLMKKDVSDIIANISNFQSWMDYEVQSVNGNESSINDMLAGKAEAVMKKGNLTSEEFDKLYNVFRELTQNEKISTYEPYIKSVTHHWHKDVYWEKDEWSAYKEGQEKVYDGEFEGVNESITANDREELKKVGKFYYKGTSSDSIEQEEDGMIVTGEPWHYKVKNWIEYGYYFIYDGNVETAKEIEDAKDFLAGKKSNKPKIKYDPTNPLLLSQYKNANENDDTQKNLFSSAPNSATIKEIDQTAEKINKDLRDNGYKVELKKVEFKKNSSLTAFSILESVHTEDSDYIYDELKEFMIEMGYFTKEDFETIETDVLEWLIPDYQVYKDEWPNLKYERIDTEYGAYIRSKISLATQKYREGENGESSSTSTSSNSTNKYINQNSSSGILSAGKKCWEYIVDDGGYSYGGGAQIPLTNGKIVDCSSFISWVLYEYGYKDFEGGQKNTTYFLNTNFKEKYGWTEINVNGDCTSQIKPGDILVRSEHITLVKSIESDGRIMSYDCGGVYWQKENREVGVNQNFFIKEAGVGKIIRNIKPGGSSTSTAFKLDKNSSNTTTTAGVDETKVNASDYGEEGFATVTTVRGISYKNYKQGTYPNMGVSSTYSQMCLSKSSDTFGYVGCGPTSTAVVLSAYGITGKTGKDSLPFLCGELEGTHTGGTDSCNQVKLAFDHYKVPATVYTVGSDAKNTIDKALKDGRPIVANVNGGTYSPGGHYIAILGYDNDNKLVISNPCGSGIYGAAGYSVGGPVTLDYFVSNCLGGGSGTFLIPDEAPTGFNFTTSVEEIPELEGYETGLDVIMPETGRIIEIGKVEEDSGETKTTTNSEEKNENKESEETTKTTTQVTKKTTEISKRIYVGDSRTVGMQQSVPANSSDVWSCKGSMGYDWMVSTGVPAIESQVTNGTAIFIWMGINGLQGTDAYANKFISYVDGKAEEWAKKGATTYFVSIGPVDEVKEVEWGYSTKNSDIEYFNKAVQKGLKKAQFIDIYSDMKSKGFNTGDGLHYTVDTYNVVYTSINEKAKTGSTSVEINPDDTSDTTHIITKGDYILIEFDTTNGVNGWKMRIEGFDLDTVNVQKDMTLDKGEVIGITNEYNMKLILYDDKDAIIGDIEDYFVLQKRDKNKRNNISNDKYGFFYFVIYESGVLTAEGNGPESVGACQPGVEHGVGICQWTSMVDGSLSNIQKLCEQLYNLDNNLCAPLKKYIGMHSSTLINEYAMSPSYDNSILRQDFKSICAKDRDKFLELQMQIAIEEKYEIFDDLGLSWVKDRPMVVQGTLGSLVNWGPALGWENSINPSMTDEEVIINLLKHACTKTSTVGSLNSRWNPQAKAAIEILHGNLDAERFCTEQEYCAPYSTGTNLNYLSTQ